MCGFDEKPSQNLLVPMTTHTAGKLWGLGGCCSSPDPLLTGPWDSATGFKGPSLWQEGEGPSCPLKALSGPKVRNLGVTPGTPFSVFVHQEQWHTEGCILGDQSKGPTRAFCSLWKGPDFAILSILGTVDA